MTNEQAITRVKHSSMYIDDRETADYIIKVLEQNERLKYLSKDWLREKKTLSGKLEKIRQIVNDKHYSVKSLTYEIKEVLEKEQL